MAEKQWCPGCSREVEGVCHHFNCAIGPNGLDAQSRSSAATEGPYAWRCCDRNFPHIYGIVTDRRVTVDAWRESGIEFQALYPGGAQSPVVLGPTQEDVVAHAIMMDDGCGLTINGQRTLCDDPRAMEKPDRCYCRRSAKAALAAIAAQPPAAPVETDQLHDSRNPNHGRTGGLRDQEPRCSAGTAEPVVWIAFSGSGYVRFWTSDAKRAEEEKCRGMDLRGFTLDELVALICRIPAQPQTAQAGDWINEPLRNWTATPAPLINGAVYDLADFGPGEYIGIDVFHGETTHKFKTSDGLRYIKPERLAAALSRPHGATPSAPGASAPAQRPPE
jgi:hypothetical protein